ncbi:TPA: acid resistance repetitive basic protein Asr, partial [Serratia marcescens]|nr:acid resistance repetitive basic protein Asr [Serratia marcescens]HAU5739134.1 acid resistance repetitive basic protein Asr [Serratia marcescens]HAU5745081.1 acid resistance repetitive basic protein Asr [Serratia marcescens]HAU5756443.1 acid resistance repetitive basic protein Asr [Serratia marcescens]HAU5764389.1 acid resistance repetitive basic protein Asr [Serratia marcescens]
MKKVLALVVAAAMGLSSVAFAAEAATTAPAATATTATAAPAKAQVKHHGKKAPVQKA